MCFGFSTCTVGGTPPVLAPLWNQCGSVEKGCPGTPGTGPHACSTSEGLAGPSHLHSGDAGRRVPSLGPQGHQPPTHLSPRGGAGNWCQNRGPTHPSLRTRPAVPAPGPREGGECVAPFLASGFKGPGSGRGIQSLGVWDSPGTALSWGVFAPLEGTLRERLVWGCPGWAGAFFSGSNGGADCGEDRQGPLNPGQGVGVAISTSREPVDVSRRGQVSSPGVRQVPPRQMSDWKAVG